MKTKKGLLNWGFKTKPQDLDQLFDDLYWSKSSKIKKQAFFIVGPNHFEDAVQEVFINIYKNLSKFEAKSSIDTWVYRITLNTCLNYIRKNKKYKNDYELSDKEIALTEIEGVDPFKRKLIQEAIETLNEKHKSVFTLFFIMELKITEIADVLKIKEGTVKSRIHSSKNEVRDFLQNKGVHFE